MINDNLAEAQVELIACDCCGFSSEKSYWNTIKNKFIGTSFQKCIICDQICCVSCYQPEVRYSLDFTKKGYACNTCAEKTHKNIDRLSIPLTKLNKSMEDLKVELDEIKTITINNNLVPLFDNASEMFNEVKSNLPEIKAELSTFIANGNKLIEISHDKLEVLPEQIKKLNENFIKLFFFLGFISLILTTGQIIILIKFIFN